MKNLLMFTMFMGVVYSQQGVTKSMDDVLRGREDCEDGWIIDCADDDCCPISWIGDGYGDCEDQEWGCDLTCYDNDGGDCVGCTDSEACNYDESATEDDGSCAYEYDCAGVCGGELEFDCCGVCGGDNSQCSNCCGMPFPDDCSEVCYFDNCGVCDDIPENDCVQDCAGNWDGDALLDNCGMCDSDPTNDCGYECGSWGGDAFLDECGVCNGDGPEEHHDCDGNCLVELDCAGNCCVLGDEGCYWQETGPCGESGPSNGMDECGVCGGDNSSCMTCAGVPCSDAYEDNCGVCDDIPENDCVQDCAGAWGGELEWDCAGICGGDNSSYDGCCGLPPNDDCTDDCYIDSLGACCIEEDADECGLCFGDGTSCCEDGETNNDNPCNPWECYDGQWVEIIIDCAEQEGIPCEGGVYVPPAEGECCSICVLSGDLNGDGTINVIDIVMTVGLILNNNYDVVGDVNGDGLLNVIDVVMLVNLVLNETGCSDGSSWDYDMDGICDVDDTDDDNDGAIDPYDSNDNNEYVCSDVDGDNCDDCSSGTFDPANDGIDMNGNGICDEGEANNDTDGDGVIDDEDYAPYDPYVCSDNDGDTCDDCSSGHYDTSDDGYDYDGDGQCDAGDCDDDNDGCQECWDYCP